MIELYLSDTHVEKLSPQIFIFTFDFHVMVNIVPTLVEMIPRQHICNFDENNKMLVGVADWWVFNPSSPGQNEVPFRRRHFQGYFHEWKVLYLDSNLSEFCSYGSN